MRKDFLTLRAVQCWDNLPQIAGSPLSLQVSSRVWKSTCRDVVAVAKNKQEVGLDDLQCPFPQLCFTSAVCKLETTAAPESLPREHRDSRDNSFQMSPQPATSGFCHPSSLHKRHSGQEWLAAVTLGAVAMVIPMLPITGHPADRNSGHQIRIAG